MRQPAAGADPDAAVRVGPEGFAIGVVPDESVLDTQLAPHAAGQNGHSVGGAPPKAAGVSDLNFAPAALTRSRMVRRSLSERDRRSSFQTTSVSPERSWSSILCNSGRSHLPPDAASSNSLAHPASLSARIWGAVSWVSDLENFYYNENFGSVYYRFLSQFQELIASLRSVYFVSDLKLTHFNSPKSSTKSATSWFDIIPPQYRLPLSEEASIANSSMNSLFLRK